MSFDAVRRRAASFFGVLLLGAMPLSVPAQQPLPPAATPGGAQPRPPAESPLVTPSAPFNVPRVPARPLGIDEGPRVRVRRFDLLGAATQPDVPAAAVDAVLARAIGQQPEDGYTVNQLQQVADAVAEEYRARGLILAQAVVPAQEVVGGVVNILVMEGSLGAVRFEGQKLYSEATLARPFAHLLARPVHREEMEGALLELTQYPGLTAFGVFQAGSRVGTTDLVVRTQQEQVSEFNATLDNQGSHFSGEYRANLGMVLNNPLGAGDRFHLFGLFAFDPDDGKAEGRYGGFDYQLPIAGPRNQLRLGWSRNQFEVGQRLRLLRIVGTTSIADLAFSKTFVKSRLGDFSAEAGLAHKDAQFSQLGTLAANDVLTVGRLGIRWSNTGVRSRGITQLAVDYSHGFDSLFGAMGDYDAADIDRASRLGADGAFDKATLSLQRYQRLTANQALLLRVSGQYSHDLLVSLEQFSIGGPDTVRAYPGAEFLADSGAFASLEWVVNAPGFAARPGFGGRTWGQLLQVSLFVDHAAGKLNRTLAGEDARVHLTGAGLGLQLNVPGKVFARIDAASPLGGPQPSNGRDPQYFFRLGLTF